MQNLLKSKQIQEITTYLQNFLPEATLKQYGLPCHPKLKLVLLDDQYDDRLLTSQQADQISDDPPYWIFCWASGHGLAESIMSGNIYVKDKVVIDFGSGCGVVAIAAALAGAREVHACEIDPIARQMIDINSQLNQVSVTIHQSLETCKVKADILLAADVLYERKNLIWLDQFLEKGEEVVVADSRLKQLNHPAYIHYHTMTTTSFPDYHEAKANNEVKFYRAGSSSKTKA